MGFVLLEYVIQAVSRTPGGEEVMTLFGAVLFRVVCSVFSKLFIPFERIRTSTLGDVERIKIHYVRSCLAQSCSSSLI